MTSNLPVVAVKAEPSQVARESFGVGKGEVGISEVPTTGGVDRDFASVLAEVRSARFASPASAASTRTAELMSPSLGVGEMGARLERAMVAEDSARWSATPLLAPAVYRAVDAYRELMNVSA